MVEKLDKNSKEMLMKWFRNFKNISMKILETAKFGENFEKKIQGTFSGIVKTWKHSVDVLLNIRISKFRENYRNYEAICEKLRIT